VRVALALWLGAILLGFTVEALILHASTVYYYVVA
jgi:hypothetical protein